MSTRNTPISKFLSLFEDYRVDEKDIFRELQGAFDKIGTETFGYGPHEISLTLKQSYLWPDVNTPVQYEKDPFLVRTRNVPPIDAPIKTDNLEGYAKLETVLKLIVHGFPQTFGVVFQVLRTKDAQRETPPWTGLQQPDILGEPAQWLVTIRGPSRMPSNLYAVSDHEISNAEEAALFVMNKVTDHLSGDNDGGGGDWRPVEPTPLSPAPSKPLVTA